jgi:hypothetical protein
MQQILRPPLTVSATPNSPVARNPQRTIGHPQRTIGYILII